MLVVGLLHRLDICLQDSCPAEERGWIEVEGRREKRNSKLRWRWFLCRFLRVSYPQKGPRRSAGRRRGAGRWRRGARGSSCTGRPARRTHTARQSSGVRRRREEGGKLKKVRRTAFSLEFSGSNHGEKAHRRSSTPPSTTPTTRLDGARGQGAPGAPGPPGDREPSRNARVKQINAD